jgi:hypothetical protein
VYEKNVISKEGISFFYENAKDDDIKCIAYETGQTYVLVLM